MEYTYEIRRKRNGEPQGPGPLSEVSLSLLARVRPFASLSGAVLPGVDLSNRPLNNIGFESAVLTNANFDNSDLTGANFEGADLTNATFIGSNLRNASFKDAVLAMCDFTGAILDFAILEGADIEGANFSGISSTYIYADDKTSTYRFRSGPLFIQLIKSTEPPPPIMRDPGSLRLKNPGAVRKAVGLSPTATSLISHGLKRAADKKKEKITHMYEDSPPTDQISIPLDSVVESSASERVANPGYSFDNLPTVQTRVTNPPSRGKTTYTIDDNSPGVRITRSHNGPVARPLNQTDTKGAIEEIIMRAGFRMTPGDLESLFDRSIDSSNLRPGRKAALDRYISNLSRQLEVEQRRGLSERDAARQIARQCLIALQASIN
jgi:hypothetical protein